MKKLEQKLEEWLVKKAPYQLPESLRKSLVKILPALALVIGCGMLLLAGDAYRALTISSPVEIPGFYTAYSSMTLSPSYSFAPAAWAGLGLFVVQALLMIFAFPGLRAHRKSGWNLLFAMAMVNILYNIVFYVLYYVQLNVLFTAMIGAVIGLYLLFQVRSYYTASSTTPAKTPAAPAASKE